jgi:hypothetical protein
MASRKSPPRIVEISMQIRAKTSGGRRLPPLGMDEKNSIGLATTLRTTSAKLPTGFERS